MIIEVDYNIDEVRIQGDTWKVKEPNLILSILEEVLNKIEPSGVELIKIDEDRRTTIGEW